MNPPREHEFEASQGLPEPLPAGESMLWQGSPDWRMLARRAFHVRKLLAYFSLLLLLRAAATLQDGGSPLQALRSLLGPALLAALAIALVLVLAWLSARSTVYTITDRRVVMRIGIVLTLSFNIPIARIAAAGLHVDAGGTGDIPLQLLGSDRLAWLHLWPHARAWRLSRPEPMLRCVPQAAEVARVLSQAWSRSTGLPAGTAAAPSAAAQHAGTPALAGR